MYGCHLQMVYKTKGNKTCEKRIARSQKNSVLDKFLFRKGNLRIFGRDCTNFPLLADSVFTGFPLNAD